MNRAQCGYPWTCDDRKPVVPEPLVESPGVCVQYESADSGHTSGMAHGRASWERCSGRPFDEERKRRFGGCLINSGGAPAQLLSIGRNPRPSVNRYIQPSGNLVQLMRADRPTEWPNGAGHAGRDPSPDTALGRLGSIDYRNQLQVGIA